MRKQRTTPSIRRPEAVGLADKRPTAALSPHPQRALVPQLSEDAYLAFRADIGERGVQVPLEVTAEGVVLDGHARLRAALELDFEQVEVRILAPADERQHILHAALTRRQLSASQQAALLLELEQYQELRAEAQARQRANLKQASEVATLPPRGKTRDLLAAWGGIGARTLQDAATVQAHDPELFEQVKAGELGATLAARRVRREIRDRALPEPPPLPEGPFELIYADPPWQLGNPDGPQAPENHYPTMPTDEICALQVPSADDAVLFLWAVSCLLPEALEVMAAWGFGCKSTFCWVKPSIGPGVWLRNRHELLLVGRKGDYPPPEPEDRCDSVLQAPRGRHSQKPAALYELIERMYPRASKLELFARNARAGWIAWDKEAPR